MPRTAGNNGATIGASGRAPPTTVFFTVYCFLHRLSLSISRSLSFGLFSLLFNTCTH
jgi:hypothetical protein